MKGEPAGRPRERVLGIVAVACIALQFPGDLWLSAVALAAWIAALALVFPSLLRAMWMPGFWAVTIALALAAGVVTGHAEGDEWDISMSLEGMQAGALMVVRGALIFGLTSWASRALAGARLTSLLGRVGLAPLGQAAAVAVGAIPELQARLSASRRTAASRPAGLARVRNLHELAVSAFCETVRLAQDIVARGVPGRVARIAALVGATGTGKTTAVMEAVGRLRGAGLRVGGVVQPAVDLDGARSGYDVMDVATGERMRLARVACRPMAGGSRFAFDAEGWRWAADRIREGRRAADVLVVDEIGRIEAAGGGHMDALREAVAVERARWWLLAVRSDGEAAIEHLVGGFDLRRGVDPDGAKTSASIEAIVLTLVGSKTQEEEQQ